MDVHLAAARLRGQGLTPAGLSWVLKALHPAGDEPACGIPDEINAKSMRSQYETLTTVSTPTAGTDWDLAVFKSPGDGAAFIYQSGPLGTNFYETIGGPGVSPTQIGVTPIQPTINLSGGYAMTTVEAVPVVINCLPRYPASRPAAFRKAASSITCYLVASALNNQGTVYASQLSHRHVGTFRRRIVDFANVITDMECFDVPPQEAVLALMDTGFYTSEARNGVYMPLRLSGPTQPYVNAKVLGSDTVRNSAVPAAPLVVFDAVTVPVPSFACLMRTETSVGEAYASTWVSNRVGTDITNTLATIDSGMDNLACGMVIFRGLSKDASVTIKTIDVLEVIPRLDTPALQFSQPAVAPCLKALELYYALSHELRFVYPASYNSFGTLLSTIGRVASTLWPYVSPLVAGGAKFIAERLAPPAAAAPALKPAIRASSVKPSLRSRSASRPAVPRRKRGPRGVR